ncbi:sensor domain-containing protein [Niveibacterium microcysteis]|uniref:EAL domain-containing protein n=1 Tax=Niveibacterium microcysteis TaxID=2811415 RepID=A0ABX7M9H9_9RHOO|nr:EAL domain-containing protein [Niveibacterium microcysteis]QSI78395.1 EAL domain-containing protein [Niveibacterium microcysteis]
MNDASPLVPPNTVPADMYATLFDNLINGLAYCRAEYEGDTAVDFIYLLVNEAFCRQTGLPDVTGRRASEAIPGITQTDRALIERYGRVARGGAAERFEHYVEALKMWFSISVFSPAPDHFIAVFDVITERKNAELALRQSERRLARVIEGSDQGFWEWNLQTGEFSVSPRFETMLGYAPGEMKLDPANWPAYVDPDDLRLAHESIRRHTEGAIPAHEVELRMLTKSGAWHWVLTCGRVVERDAAGNPTMMSGTHTDIHQKKQAELALRQAAAVYENTQEGVLITDADGHIVSVNRAFTAMTGYTLDEVLGMTASILKSGRHDAVFFAAMWAEIAATGRWQGELWNRRKNGEIYPQLTSISAVRDGRGHVSRYVGVLTDISAIKASEERLEFLAHHDPLTNLPNRLTLFSRIERAMKVAKREGHSTALLMLDLDRFKDVNDSFGHLVGDSLLQRVAEGLRCRLREVDTLSRLGGDEFTILLEKLHRPDDASRVAEDILDTLRTPWTLPGGSQLRVSASIGIAHYPGSAVSPEELLQQADAAMYRAKREGRGRYHYFSQDLTHAARARLELESALRSAIENGELRAYFQPQIDIRSGHLVGAEALVRWHKNGDRVIAPDAFIPLAEETGLIVPLGEWMLREACHQASSWPARRGNPLGVAVNVAAAQIRRADFADMVLGILAGSGLPPERLELELTESSLQGEEDAGLAQLARLRDAGVRIAIDDFGTGYSSLAYLKRLPLDVLKIDRSFVEHVVNRRDDREIVTAIVQIGRTLGFKVIAEGVETQAQLDILDGLACDLYQGYLCSKPLPAEDFMAFAKHGTALGNRSPQ